MTTSVLVIGDTHIPDRSSRIPPQLRDRIERGRPWDIVVFTGDLTEVSVLQWVKTLGKAVYVVRGNMDYLPLPKTSKFDVDGFTFGVHHGDGVYPRGDVLKLSRIAKELEVDILLTGHTHSDFVKISPNGTRLIVNPGSLTGVWGGGGGSYTPSYAVLTVERGAVRVEIYKLVGGVVESTYFSFRKTNGVFVQEP